MTITIHLLAIFGAAVLLFGIIWIIEEWLHISPAARELISFVFFCLVVLCVPVVLWLIGKLFL